MTFATLVALSLTASAADPGARDPETHERLLAAFNTHFFPERVAEPVHLGASHHAEAGEGFACLTELVAELKANWDLFSPAERREMTGVLAPWQDDLTSPMDAGGAVAPPDTCFGLQYDNHVESDHFSVQWEEGAITEAEAEAFIESLEYSWQVEVEEQGWEPPQGVDTYQMLVMVPKADSYAGAYTTVTNCSGVGQVPYIVAYSGSFNYGDWWKTMACHEFNHASQFSYGDSHEFWWWEATATYVEEIVYPEYNDWADMVWVYSQVPYIGMNAYAGNSNDQYLFYHTYSMAIWAFYLDQHVGGHDLVRQTWEYAADDHGYYNLWMPEVIDGLGYDFDDVYEGFVVANAVREYDERNYYSEVESEDTIRSLPFSGESNARTLPQSLGQNFWEIDAGAGLPGHQLHLTFQGDPEPDHWYVLLVLGSRTVDEVVSIEVDENGWGEGAIDFTGDSDAWLVVSPRFDEAQGYRYSWTRADDWEYTFVAELVDPAAADDPGEDVAPPDATDDGDDEGGLHTCACSGTGAAGGLVWLAGLSLAAVRRRRA